MTERLNSGAEHYAVKARGIPCYATGEWDQAWNAPNWRGPLVFTPCRLYTLRGVRALWLEKTLSDHDWSNVKEQIKEQIFDADY